MKNYLYVVLFMLLAVVQGDSQIQFELSDIYAGTDGWWGASSEIEDGYLLLGASHFSNTLVLGQLDLDGNLLDTSLMEMGEDTFYLPKVVMEKNDAYIAMGFAVVEGDSLYSFWQATYSKSLVLQELFSFPIDGMHKGEELAMNLFYDAVSDKVLFVGQGVSGWLNPATKEVFYKELINNYLIQTAITPRRKPGYLVSGYGIHLLDENFNSESYFNYFVDMVPCGWAGLDVEYITDSTFMFASHYDNPNTNDYVDSNTSGVVVGVMNEDFDVLNIDTLIMPYEATWGILPFAQYLLEKSIDSTYIVGGITWPYQGDYRHLFFARYSNTGERLTYTTFSTLKDYRYDANIKATSDGGCLFYGARRGTGEFEFYVMKVGPNGIVTGETSIPMKQSPIKVYPNPTSDIITFDLKGNYRILDFELVDLAGHIVLRQEVSGHEEISTSHLPKGVYGYRLLGDKGEVVYSGKMVKE